MMSPNVWTLSHPRDDFLSANCHVSGRIASFSSAQARGDMRFKALLRPSISTTSTNEHQNPTSAFVCLFAFLIIGFYATFWRTEHVLQGPARCIFLPHLNTHLPISLHCDKLCELKILGLAEGRKPQSIQKSAKCAWSSIGNGLGQLFHQPQVQLLDFTKIWNTR